MMLTMKAGQVQDKALLMASMFRAVKFETQAEVELEFKANQAKRDDERFKKIIGLVKTAVIDCNESESSSEDSGSDESGTESNEADSGSSGSSSSDDNSLDASDVNEDAYKD